jgi:hypothetical protein
MLSFHEKPVLHDLAWHKDQPDLDPRRVIAILDDNTIVLDLGGNHVAVNTDRYAFSTPTPQPTRKRQLPVEPTPRHKALDALLEVVERDGGYMTISAGDEDADPNERFVVSIVYGKEAFGGDTEAFAKYGLAFTLDEALAEVAGQLD